MTLSHGPSAWRAFERPPFPAFTAAGVPLLIGLGETALTVRRGGETVATLPLVRGENGMVRLGEGEISGTTDAADVMAAACEALFGFHPSVAQVQLDVSPASGLAARLLHAGIATLEAGQVVVAADLLWQQPQLWLASAGGAYPQRMVLNGSVRHPLRAPKTEGRLYARFIPWIGKTVSFHMADPDLHLEPFHRWMNDPRVAEIWEETGDLAQHRAYLDARRADPHVWPLIGCFDDAPFGYFELYWAKENRLGPHYDAHDYDRGWHVLVGEDAFRGKAWLTAWLPSLMHLMFLDDPRTQRIVGEPKATHAQQIRNLDRSGFAKVKHVDFAHKRALLVMLMRERFFGDRLWLPAPEAEVAAPASLGASA